MLLSPLKQQFFNYFQQTSTLLQRLPESVIWSSDKRTVGEAIVRGAGVLEQTFGGLTSSLWDDPFEWTLPETLNSKTKVLEYIDEAQRTAEVGLSLIAADDDLKKEVIGKDGQITTIFLLLIDALTRAHQYYGMALMLSTSRRDVTTEED